MGVGEELTDVPADVPASTFGDKMLVQAFIDIDRFESFWVNKALKDFLV